MDIKLPELFFIVNTLKAQLQVSRLIHDVSRAHHYVLQVSRVHYGVLQLSRVHQNVLQLSSTHHDVL